MKKRIIVIPFLLLFFTIFAQTKQQKCFCCSEKNRQFDFWLGEWEVFDTLGNKVGENNILALQDSCVIQENWSSLNSTGTSYNYYKNEDSTWNQLWIDNTGSVLELKGSFHSNKMILKSGITIGPKGKSYYNRIIWEKNNDASVTQTWQIFDEKDQILTLAFKGIYKSKKLPGKESKVTGVGGIFFKCKDPAQMKEWYSKNLGFNTDQYGTNFEWREGTDCTKKGYTQWSPFSESTRYFMPSVKDFMINYRVENITLLVEQLKKEGVIITDSIEVYEYGKFIHIMDPEGNKIELWEPDDIEYDKIVGGRTK